MAGRSESDEAYALALCDDVLGLAGLRQHRFAFLRGDSRDGRPGRQLPVDAYYPELSLVIEYRERQHIKAVPFFDKPDRMTVSGVDRRLQREFYDQRRRDVLPAQGIRLIELSYERLAHSPRGKLLRDRAGDLRALRKLLEPSGRQSEQARPADGVGSRQEGSGAVHR